MRYPSRRVAQSVALGGPKGFTVTCDIDADVVSGDAEKLRFASSFVPPQGAKELSGTPINEAGEHVGANP